MKTSKNNRLFVFALGIIIVGGGLYLWKQKNISLDLSEGGASGVLTCTPVSSVVPTQHITYPGKPVHFAIAGGTGGYKLIPPSGITASLYTFAGGYFAKVTPSVFAYYKPYTVTLKDSSGASAPCNLVVASRPTVLSGVCSRSSAVAPPVVSLAWVDVGYSGTATKQGYYQESNSIEKSPKSISESIWQFIFQESVPTTNSKFKTFYRSYAPTSTDASKISFRVKTAPYVSSNLALINTSTTECLVKPLTTGVTYNVTPLSGLCYSGIKNSLGGPIVNLSWAPVSYATQNLLQRKDLTSTSSSFVDLFYENSKGTKFYYTDTSAQSGKRYEYRVKAGSNWISDSRIIDTSTCI